MISYLHNLYQIDTTHHIIGRSEGLSRLIKRGKQYFENKMSDKVFAYSVSQFMKKSNYSVP